MEKELGPLVRVDKGRNVESLAIGEIDFVQGHRDLQPGCELPHVGQARPSIK